MLIRYADSDNYLLPHIDESGQLIITYSLDSLNLDSSVRLAFIQMELFAQLCLCRIFVSSSCRALST